MNHNKFKSNPFNSLNFLIQEEDINNIIKTYNINDFKINNIKIYQTAFIHKSYCKMKLYEEYENEIKALPLQETSYETMEFLGDSILGYIVCEYIYKRYTEIYNQDEGFLTKMKNRLVCGETLAILSDKMGFNKYLVISKHIDDNCNGRNNKNILEDTFEAFIGALYLDTNDILFVKEFLINIYEKYIDFTDIIINDTNYKDQLLRYFQNTFGERPRYNIVKNDDNTYTCDVLKKSGTSEDWTEVWVCNDIGVTKKKAEQNASKKALIKYGVLN